jgi:hypothetical protein
VFSGFERCAVHLSRALQVQTLRLGAVYVDTHAALLGSYNDRDLYCCDSLGDNLCNSYEWRYSNGIRRTLRAERGVTQLGDNVREQSTLCRRCLGKLFRTVA